MTDVAWAIVGGGVLILFGLVAGHYVFQPPRWKMHELVARIYGILFCDGLAIVPYLLVTRSWSHPAWLPWLFFAWGAVVTGGMWAFDWALDTKGELHRTQRAAGDGPR